MIYIIKTCIIVLKRKLCSLC